MKGYILLYRSIYDHWVWGDPKYFYRWCDLLMLAAYQRKIIYFEGVEHTQERGQVITSQRKLSIRWSTNNDGVKEFLNKLKRSDMITHLRKGKATIINICNYDRFQIALKDDDFDPYSDGFFGSQYTESSSEIRAENATKPSRKRSTTNKRNKKNKTINPLSEKTREQGFLDEVFQKDKLKYGCESLGVGEEVFRQVAQQVVNDWIFNEEESWDFKHLLNTMRIKIAAITKENQKQKSNGKTVSKNRSSDGRGERGAESGENPLNRAKVHRAKTEES